MRKVNFQKRLEFLNNQIESHKKAAVNAISDDARREIEERITELQQLVDDLKKLEADSADGTDDKTEQMRAQMAEMMSRLDAMENRLKAGEETANQVRKVVNSKAFAVEFQRCVQNSRNGKEFKQNFRELLKKHVKNNIDDENIADFMPAFIVNEINDQFVGKRHRLLELVDWTGLPCFKALWETGNDMANVHERGTQKTEQELEFEKIEIRPDLIYKYLKLDRIVEMESRDAGDVLMRYVTRELLDRLLTTIENYIVTGTAPFNAPKEVVTQPAGTEALAYMEDVDGAIAIMSPSTYLKFKNTLRTEYNPTPTHDQVLAVFGVEEIVFNKSTYVPTTPNATWTGVLFMRPSDYKIVGQRRPDQFTDFNLAYNQNEYLMEILIGGGCIVPNNYVALVDVA